MKVRIAQLGVGYWGPNLLRNLCSNEYCEVKIVVDVSEERRRYLSNLFPSIKISQNIDDVLQNNEIDAVVIATPVSTHFDLSIKCLNAGKHVLVEKPMAKTCEEVRKIADLAERNELIAMVGHTFLFNSAVRYVKDLLIKGELGEVRYIYSQRLNLGRIRSDVDALWNLAPHDISIIQYWLDDPTPDSVVRTGQSFIQNDIDDVVFLNLKYSNGVMANIHVSWLDPHKTRKMVIVGSEKMLLYDDIAEDKIVIYDKAIERIAILGQNMDFDNPSTFNFNHRSEGAIIPKIPWTEPLKAEIEHFIDCIQNRVTCLTGTKHAEKVVGVLERAS